MEEVVKDQLGKRFVEEALAYLSPLPAGTKVGSAQVDMGTYSEYRAVRLEFPDGMTVFLSITDRVKEAK